MFASLLVALVFFVTSVVEMHDRIIGVGKEEAFLFILCPFCLRNRSDGVKAINYLIDICKFDKVGCTPIGEMGSIRKWALT